MNKEIQVETPEEKEVFDAMTKEQSKQNDDLKMKSKLHEQLTKAVKNIKLQETLKQYPSLTSVDIAEMLADELERMDALEGNQENEVIVNQSYEG